MILFAKVYFPRFFKAPSEKSIDAKLSARETLNWERDKYQSLLKLKQHGSRIITSLCELKAITKTQETDSLYACVEGVMQKAISNRSFNPALYSNELNNRFTLLKAKIAEDKKLDKCFSGLNIVTNSIFSTVGFLGVVLFGMAITTGPLGAALFAVGMTIASALVATITAYSAYVDARFIGDKQLKEIEAGINFISNYPNGALLDEVDERNTLFCI